MRKYFLFILVFVLSGCGGIVNSFHERFDDQEHHRRSGNYPKSKFSMYKQRSSRRGGSMYPVVKRKYNSKSNGRHSADDLNDNSSGGSLWTTGGQDNFLFSKNNKKHVGDIVVIKVLDKLKTDITLELKRRFPPMKGAKKKAPAAADGAEAGGGGKGPKALGESADGPFYDTVSSVIIEEINKDHILLRGKKDLLFRNRKRLVEIQAMISRRDIADDDSVLSTRILDSNIRVLR